MTWLLALAGLYLCSWLLSLAYCWTRHLVAFVADDEGQQMYFLHPIAIPLAVLRSTFKSFLLGWPYLLLGPFGLPLMVVRDMIDARIEASRDEMEEDTVDFVSDYVESAMDHAMDPNPGDDLPTYRDLN